MNIDDLKSLMDGFDPASLLPELETVTGSLASIARFAVMVGPVIMLIMGLLYLLAAPKEANYYFGYRCYFGMGSIEAWRYTQRIAGLVLGAVGLALTAVMFFASGDFEGMAVADALGKALRAILWEAGIIAVTCIGINTLVAMNFTADGEIRPRRRK